MRQHDIIEYARNLYEAHKLVDNPISVDEAILIAEQKVNDMYNLSKGA